MNRAILIQALQSEGVVDEVIRAALFKVEMYNMEVVAMNRIEREMDKVSETYNVFAHVVVPEFAVTRKTRLAI